MAEHSATFEVGTDGNNVATGDTGSPDAWDDVYKDGTNTITYDNDHPAASSTMGAKFVLNGTSDLAYLEWQSIGGGTDHYGRFYLYGTAPGVNREIVGFRNSSGSNHGGIWWLGNGKLGLYTLGGVDLIASTSASFPVNSLTRVEYHFGHSNTAGFARLKTFNDPQSETATEDIGADSGAYDTLATGNFERCTLGCSVAFSSVTNWTMYWDEIVVGAATWPGPADEPATGRVARLSLTGVG